MIAARRPNRLALPSLLIVLFGVIGLSWVAYALAWPLAGTASYLRFESNAQLAGETSASITIDDAADQIAIAARDIGNLLYTAKIDYVGSAPGFSFTDGRVRITRSSNFVSAWGRARDVVELTISPSVAWTISIDAAGTTSRIDVTNARLQSFEVDGAASNVTITAGLPHGAVRVGADGVGTRLTLRLPGTVDYQVRAEGIGSAVDGAERTPGWATAQDRYDVTVNGVGMRATVTASG